jgi:hypothetical protein
MTTYRSAYIDRLRPVIVNSKPDLTTARGRNGWFRLHRLDVSYSPATEHRGARIDLDGVSRQKYRNVAPVHLELSPEDALRLWSALGAVLKVRPCVCGRGDTCPNCQP